METDFEFRNSMLLVKNIGLDEEFKHHSAFLTLSQTSHGFYMSEVQVFRKHSGKRRNCS